MILILYLINNDCIDLSVSGALLSAVPYEGHSLYQSIGVCQPTS